MSTSEPSAIREVVQRIQQFVSLRRAEIGALLKETVNAWVDDNAPRLGASLAFYTMLSLAPLLVVVVAVAALAFGQKAAQGQLVWEIQDLVGTEGARAIQSLIQSAYKPATGAVPTVLGVLTLAFGASAAVAELRDALNTIWHVPVAPAFSSFHSVLGLVRERFYLFGLILSVGFLLLVSLALNAAITALGILFGSLLPASESVLRVGVFLISFLVVTFLFAAIYKFLPDVPLKWSDVIVGACFTSLLFTIGKQLIGIYLGKASFGSTYGAAGSLVIVLVWVYYSAQLFFFGAEFTKVYTEKFGSRLDDKLKLHPPKPPGVIVDPTSGLPAGKGNEQPRVLSFGQILAEYASRDPQ
ncbi:MAG: YihY/virulence factor BrkB family protein [Bryobacteraceae bacterium]|jgi:membrane protein